MSSESKYLTLKSFINFENITIENVAQIKSAICSMVSEIVELEEELKEKFRNEKQ